MGCNEPWISDLLFNQQSEGTISDVSQTGNAVRPLESVFCLFIQPLRPAGFILSELVTFLRRPKLLKASLGEQMCRW